MKLKEIFELTPIEKNHHSDRVISALKQLTSKDGKELLIAKLLNSFELIDEKDLDNDKRIENRVYLNEGDDKYGARLFSVFFDNMPVMVIKNNGRYYEDHECYIANSLAYEKLENYIISNLKIENTPEKHLLEEDIVDLEVVGDYDLKNHYVKDLNPKYAIGDRVWAWVEENHLKQSYSNDYKGYILTQVEVKTISEFDPIKTYGGVQCERGWSKNNAYTMILGSEIISPIGTQFSDEVIVGKVSDIPMPKFAINHFIDENGVTDKNYQVTLDNLIDILSRPEAASIKLKIK